MENKINSFLILGSGYCGHFLEKKLVSLGQRVYKTSRTQKGLISFDLNQPETWSNLPRVAGTFWTFPANNSSMITPFLDQYKNHLGRIVYIGTTGSFKVTQEHELISEKSPLEESQPRVQGEEILKKFNGKIVYSSGIYGPARNPHNWVQKGWVTPQKKYFNCIHVADLCEILWATMNLYPKENTFIGSDGTPLFWDNIIRFWKDEYKIEVPFIPKPKSPKISKKIDPSWSLQTLKVRLQYPSIHHGIASLYPP